MSIEKSTVNFLSEQEVQITEASSCLPLFPCKIVKLNPLFSQLPPSNPSRFLISLCKWQGGRSRGGGGGGGGMGAGGPEPPPLFVCMFCCSIIFGITIIFGKTCLHALKQPLRYS